MKVNLDNSVYNRPFDDQGQPRIELEAMAFTLILQMIEAGKIDLVVSSVNRFETSRNPFPTRRSWVERWYGLGKVSVLVDESVRERANKLEQLGLHPLDVLHAACAEKAEADWFLTCDDRLLRKYAGQGVQSSNPVDFVLQVAGG
jgi:predicted nucleic acid-binding protein